MLKKGGGGALELFRRPDEAGGGVSCSPAQVNEVGEDATRHQVVVAHSEVLSIGIIRRDPPQTIDTKSPALISCRFTNFLGSET